MLRIQRLIEKDGMLASSSSDCRRVAKAHDVKSMRSPRLMECKGSGAFVPSCSPLLL